MVAPFVWKKNQRVELLSQKNTMPYPVQTWLPGFQILFGGVCLPRNEPKTPLTVRGDLVLFVVLGLGYQLEAHRGW